MGLGCFQRPCRHSQLRIAPVLFNREEECCKNERPFYEKKNRFFTSCSPFLLVEPFQSFFFRDLVILTKFCQTRSIGSPDAFFQFPLKCFQQRLPFLLIKENTLHLMERLKKVAKKRERKYPLWQSTDPSATKVLQIH